MGHVEQVTCGVVGLGVAFVVLAAGYSAVVALASVVPLLSTTIIVFAWVFLWLATWLALAIGLGLVRSRLAAPQDV